MRKWMTGLLVLVAGVISGLILASSGLLPRFGGTTTEERNTQIVQALQREQEVALLSLGIQGIAEREVATTVFGLRVPGTGRVLFLQYNFTAKLGMDGSQVTVEPDGDKRFVVTIPEFEVLGHNDIKFRVAVENNGVISWITPEIDTADLITQIMNDEALSQHVKDNQDLLRDQARAFYTGIIQSVDPEVVVDFKFLGSTK